MRLKFLFIFIVCTFVLAFPISPVTADDPPLDVDGNNPARTHGKDKGPDNGRVLITTDGDITDSMLDELENHGVVHLVINRYDTVAFTPKGKQERDAVAALPFVTSMSKDHSFSLSRLGTWDRDMIDAVDVEDETGSGDPDAREVKETGKGVHVAVIDTGLIPEWREWLPESQVATDLARTFGGGGATDENSGQGNPNNRDDPADPTDKWQNDTDSHGTSVASYIIGFKAVANSSVIIDGVAPEAKVIPLKVFPNGNASAFESQIIAALAYVTDLKDSGAIDKVVVNLSLGGLEAVEATRTAINEAIAHGVIVVAAAGNEGETGMHYPGAFPEVISVGATGWTRQFRPNQNFWIISDVPKDNPDGSGKVEAEQSYVASLSSRARDGEELDIVAPGVFSVAPGYPITSGSKTAGRFFQHGTSFSSPLAAGVAALMLEKNGGLSQSDVESILKDTAISMKANDSRSGVLSSEGGSEETISWDDCGGDCDPVGAGLLQADAALKKTPK